MLLRFGVCAFIVVASLVGAEDVDEETAACKAVLEEKMKSLKQWLTDSIAEGPSKKSCDHQAVQKMMTDFGMEKIECDKKGKYVDFVFPVAEYQAWTTMCPQAPPPDVRDEEEVTKDGEEGKEGESPQSQDDVKKEVPPQDGGASEAKDGETDDADDKEKETQVCKVKLVGQMKALKEWLKEKLSLGKSDEACKHQEAQDMLNEFGKTKIACDKNGNYVDFDFPAEDYKKWTEMCPPPSFQPREDKKQTTDDKIVSREEL